MNSFQTPHKELFISTSAGTITIITNKVKSYAKIMIGLLTSFICLVLGIYFLLQFPAQLTLFGLQITNIQIISGLIIFSLSFFIDLFFIHQVLLRNTYKRLVPVDRWITQIIPIIPLWACVFFVYDMLLTRIFNTGHFLGTFGYFVILNAFIIVIPMYWWSSIEITIKKDKESYKVEVFEIIPFIHKQRLNLFHNSVANLFLAIMPFSTKFKHIQLIVEDLDEFSWLTLEDIQNLAQEKVKDQLICFLVSNKNEFTRNLGFRLGTKISSDSLKKFLNYINEIITVSIIKLEYTKQKTLKKPNLVENQ